MWFLRDMADRTKVRRAERGLVLPHLAIDGAKTGRQTLEPAMQRATLVLPQLGGPKIPETPLAGMLNCAFSGKSPRSPLNAISIRPGVAVLTCSSVRCIYR